MKVIPAGEAIGRRFRVVYLDRENDDRPAWILGRIGECVVVGTPSSAGLRIAFRCPTCGEVKKLWVSWRELEPVREAKL